MGNIFAVLVSLLVLSHVGHQQRMLEKWTPLIIEKAQKYDLDPVLIASVIQVESSWYPKSVSSAGACGLMQVIPKWNPKADGTLYTCDELKDPAVGIEAGSKALRWWMDRSNNNTNLALCSYNAGFSCFKKMKYSYVKRVMNVYNTIVRK